MRHAVTRWNEEGRFIGSTNLSLTSRGVDQAVRLRERLQGHQFTGIWSSDLLRATQTASHAGSIPCTDTRLRELDFGRLEGLRWGDLDDQTRTALVEFEHFAAPGGETVAQLSDRVGSFLHDLPDGRHLVFTHGGVIRAIAKLHNIDPLRPAPVSATIVTW